MTDLSIRSVTNAQQKKRQQFEKISVGILRAFGIIAMITTFLTIFILFEESLGFFAEVPVTDFLFGTTWAPLISPTHFGVLPIVVGTLMVAVGASLVAVPLGVLIAFYLSEYATPAIRRILKPSLELLAGIPSIVFGYFALSAITPAMRYFDPEIGIFNAASAAIVVGIMILPLVASMSDDAFQAVPGSLRQAGYALGATKVEVLVKILLPAASSGVIGSFILAFSRALGETMAVTLAAGSTPKMGLDYFDSIQAMTAYIVQVSMGDVPHGTIEYKTIFVVGLVLFLMTLAINMLAQYVIRRLRRNFN